MPGSVAFREEIEMSEEAPRPPHLDDVDVHDLDSCVAWWFRNSAAGTLTPQRVGELFDRLPDAQLFADRLDAARRDRLIASGRAVMDPSGKEIEYVMCPVPPEDAQYDVNDLESCVAWWLRMEKQDPFPYEEASVMLHNLPDGNAFWDRLNEVRQAARAQSDHSPEGRR